MSRFNKLTGDYDPAWEEVVKTQIAHMQDMTGRDYYEIWCGTDGYSVAKPERKLYDSLHDDDTALREVTTMSFKDFKECVIPRCGCAYSLNREDYPVKTGQPFPDYIDDDAVIVINFATEWFKYHYLI